MLINYVSGVFVATTRDREEGAKLKALGGWRWHSGACDARWCKSNCPAKGVTGWWTTNAQTAARVTGEGVHAADSLAAIGAAKQAARVAPSRSPRIEFAKGVFFIVDADRGESEAIRAASGGDQRWRWHSQECSAKFCRKPCPVAGVVTDSWWTSDATLVRPLQAYLGDTARIELENRDNSLALSRAVSEGYSGDLPCPAGKSYLPFQAAGIRYAMSRPSSLIGDEMGLGKTVQAVGTVNADSAARTVLVICPAFLREVWNRHAVEWSVRQTRVVVLETPADVARAKKKDLLSRKGDETLWVVISYGGCRAESAVGKLVHAAVALASIDVLILDESHRTKEREAQQSQGAIALAKKAKRILALSGTPIPNRPIEMATTLSMLNPNFAFWRFAHRYCGAKQHRFGWDLSGATHLDELQRELRETVMIRRLKADVLKELPKKTWSVVVLDSSAIPTDLVASRVISDKSERAKATRMIAEAVGDKAAIRAAVDAELTALGIAFDGMSKERSALGGHKVEPALDYLSKLPQSECVIVFTHHKAVASAIYARLGGEKCGVYLDGSVDAEERVNRVDQFQGSSDPTFRYVVATIESAKEGLTITRASRVVFVEQSFTPGTMSQAEDRAHRIGQTRGVQVDYLVFDGTMDAYLCQMLAAKQSVATAALDSESDYVETAQNEVVLREEQPLPTEEFDAHDPSRYMRGVGGNAGGTRETDEQYARRTAERRGVTTAYQPTESEIAAVLAGMRALTEDDADRATEENGIGFAKSDVYVGHALAQLGTLTPELWALGARLCRKYRGQLGGEIVDATGVERA